jgi:hypothetical protein
LFVAIVNLQEICQQHGAIVPNEPFKDVDDPFAVYKDSLINHRFEVSNDISIAKVLDSSFVVQKLG